MHGLYILFHTWSEQLSSEVWKLFKFYQKNPKVKKHILNGFRYTNDISEGLLLYPLPAPELWTSEYLLYMNLFQVGTVDYTAETKVCMGHKTWSTLGPEKFLLKSENSQHFTW